MMKFVKRIMLIGFALGFVACADDSIDDPVSSGSLRIVNQSQYRIEELRVHQSKFYLDSPNRLREALEINEEHFFYGLGDWNVTVYREKFSQGPIIAVTTSEHVVMESAKGQKLIVFDESFRLSDDEWIQPGVNERPQTNRDGGLQDASSQMDSGASGLDAGQSQDATVTSDAGTSTTSADAG